MYGGGGGGGGGGESLSMILQLLRKQYSAARSQRDAATAATLLGRHRLQPTDPGARCDNPIDLCDDDENDDGGAGGGNVTSSSSSSHGGSGDRNGSDASVADGTDSNSSISGVTSSSWQQRALSALYQVYPSAATCLGGSGVQFGSDGILGGSSSSSGSSSGGGGGGGSGSGITAGSGEGSSQGQGHLPVRVRLVTISRSSSSHRPPLTSILGGGV